MPEPVAFRWVEIDGFRGFRDRQRILLDASAVVVVGPNGSGKTSFFDALQWLMVGSLERLERLRVRRNAEHIVNAYRGSDPAIVEAEVKLAGRLVHLRRQGRYDGGALEWTEDGETVSGDEAERRLHQALAPKTARDVRRLLMTSALLQQDVVREVLEDRPAERYTHLANLLGLDALTAFDQAARQRRSRLSTQSREALEAVRAAEQHVEQARKTLAGLIATLRLQEDVRQAREALLERLLKVKDLVEPSERPSTGADAALLQDAARELGERLTKLLRDGATLEAQRVEVEPVDKGRLQQVQLDIQRGEETLQRDETALEQAEANLIRERERVSKQSALASLALELLGPACPVCQQEIDEDHVRHHLEAKLSEGDGDSLSAAMVDVEAARAAAERSRVALAEARGVFAPLQAQYERQQQFEAGRTRWVASAAEFDASNPNIALHTLDEIRRGNADVMRSSVEALRVVWSVASELAAVMRSDQREQQIAEARATVKRAEERLGQLTEVATRASQLAARATTLSHAATDAVTAVTTKRFRQLAPLVGDIYRRLNPHPAFRNFEFAVDVYNRRGIASPVVIDEERGVEGDPLLIFSSSQANVAALSYFLAMGWAAGAEALPFVLLDDPLQSMDDINVLGFADLCRHVRRQRQMVVSTHDRRLGALLERKLTPRVATDTTRVLEFTAWTPAGPQIDQRILIPQEIEGRSRSVVEQAAA